LRGLLHSRNQGQIVTQCNGGHTCLLRLSQLTLRVKKAVMMNPSSFSSLYTTARRFPVFISRTGHQSSVLPRKHPIRLADSFEHIQSLPRQFAVLFGDVSPTLIRESDEHTVYLIEPDGPYQTPDDLSVSSWNSRTLPDALSQVES
jgi:hypothetical protein